MKNFKNQCGEKPGYNPVGEKMVYYTEGNRWVKTQ